MSLNNISLPAQLIADLYQHALVGSIATAVPQKKQISFLGKNEKNILVVVNIPAVPFLPDNELSFLTKILSACQLGLMDVAIVNRATLAVSTGELLAELPAKCVLLFDVPPEEFNVPENAASFSLHTVHNKRMVVAPALQQIEATKELKSQLWLALKELFAL